MLHSWEDSHLGLTYKGPLSFWGRLLLQEAVTLLTVGRDVNSDKVFPPASLAPQSGAHRSCAFRHFQSHPKNVFFRLCR